jgi:hypothetical protein
VLYGTQEDCTVLAISDDRLEGMATDATRELLFADVDPTDDEVRAAAAPAQPERRLMFAILADAIVRFRRLTSVSHPALRAECREAERWIRSDDRSWPCSFVNVCEALDVAYEPLRRALLRWRTTPARRRVTRRGLLISAKRSRAGVLPEE